MCESQTTRHSIFMKAHSVLSKGLLCGLRERRIDVDVKYYADGENGVKMEQDLVALRAELGLPAFKGEASKEDSASEKASEKKSKKNKKW